MGFFSKIGKNINVVKTVVNNKGNLEELNKLKDGLTVLLSDTSNLLKKLSADKNALDLAEMIGISKHVLNGNKDNVFCNYLTNAIDVHEAITPSILEKHSIKLDLEKQYKDLTHQEIVEKLKRERLLIVGEKFAMSENAITKSYSTTIEHKNWLGNKHITLFAEATLIEKNAKLSINLDVKLVNNALGSSIVTEFIRNVKLEDIAFNKNSGSFGHVNLPLVLNHYITVNSDNKLVLHFILA